MPRPCPLACKHCLNRLGGTGPKSRQVGSRASEAVAALTQHGRSRDQPLLAMPTCLDLPLLLLSLPPAAGRDWHVCPEAGMLKHNEATTLGRSLGFLCRALHPSAACAR